MEVLKKRKSKAHSIAQSIKEHWIVRLVTVLILLLTAFTLVLKVSDRYYEQSATLKVGRPFLKEERSSSRQSKHVRVPITALHGEIRDVEASISNVDLLVPILTGKKSLLFARRYKDYKQGHTHHPHQSPEDKLRHFRTHHFALVEPIDIRIGQTEEVNVLVKIEGWDEKSFLGNNKMDEFATAETLTLTLRITTENAGFEELTFTVVRANSYADIDVK